MVVNKSCVAACLESVRMAVESVSGCSWNECPDQRGITVRMCVEWVSESAWNPQREVKAGDWEEVNQIYHQNGHIHWPGYEPVCRLMRDVHTGKAVQMSHVLLDILCGIQGWFALHDIHKPIIVLSGFREESTNEKVGGKKMSAHLRGGACDLSVPGVPVDYLRRLALYLQGGGVGVYPTKKFIHVDDGNLRVWRG